MAHDPCSQARLERLYECTSDPWGFRTSPYEQAKFRATRAALAKASYRHGLELGCGNGALAEHLAPVCSAYLGLDAVAAAVHVARETVPSAAFRQVFLPCQLPQGDYDLIILSEVLYFLDCAGISQIAHQITARWPSAEVIVVTWLGPCNTKLSGLESLEILGHALHESHAGRLVGHGSSYRIDRFPHHARAQE